MTRGVKEEREEAAELFAAIAKRWRTVKQVRLLNRLVASPGSCLVGAEMDYSPQMKAFVAEGQKAADRNQQARFRWSLVPITTCSSNCRAVSNNVTAEKNKRRSEEYCPLLLGSASYLSREGLGTSKICPLRAYVGESSRQ